MLPEENFQALISARAPIPFRDFMEIALYHPLHGYYGSGRATLGRQGDYFTNVSVGSLFAQLLATQFREMWDRLNRPDPFTIVEQGANDGTFAEDLLTFSHQSSPDFFKSLQYTIVENLEVLQTRQQNRLDPFTTKVRWLNSLEALPPFTGVHFSNELIDAFPVHLVRFKNGEWRERWVTPDLEWTDKPIQNASLLDALAHAPSIEGYTTEVNLDALTWATAVAPKIEQGWLLTIDYGYPRARYYAPERRTGTLECYAAHKKGLDPLSNPGQCDLTAHVDFTTLAKAFLTAGMHLSGYTDQHHFLTPLAAQTFAARSPSPQEARSLKTLLHPELLGRSFQVLCMSRRVPPLPLSGFQFARNPLPELGI